MPHHSTIHLALTSEEAEEILFALAMRSRQSKLSQPKEQQVLALSARLNTAFEERFGWMHFDRPSHMRKPIKRVTVTCYDFQPNDNNL